MDKCISCGLAVTKEAECIKYAPGEVVHVDCHSVELLVMTMDGKLAKVMVPEKSFSYMRLECVRRVIGTTQYRYFGFIGRNNVSDLKYKDFVHSMINGRPTGYLHEGGMRKVLSSEGYDEDAVNKLIDDSFKAMNKLDDELYFGR